MKSDFVFFWGGTYSQWFPSKFTIDGVEYCTAEQYMMAKKALLFNDNDAYEKIMATKDSRKQKAIGRTVKGFDVNKWSEVSRDYVYQANYAKFTQNPVMLKELLATDGKTLVEASPEDTIWGIGLDKNDPRAWNKSTWLGSNWLGETITKVREDLIDEGY